MSITLQPQDFWGEGEKRENIILHTQNDLLHKSKKKRKYFGSKSFMGCLRPRCARRPRMETRSGNLSCSYEPPIPRPGRRPAASSREDGAGRDSEVGLYSFLSSRLLGAWQDSWFEYKGSQQVTSHMPQPATKEPGPGQTCWEQGFPALAKKRSLRLLASLSAITGWAPSQGWAQPQEARADLDHWPLGEPRRCRDGFFSL